MGLTNSLCIGLACCLVIRPTDELLRKVDDRTFLIAEAGTGTGLSLYEGGSGGEETTGEDARAGV